MSKLEILSPIFEYSEKCLESSQTNYKKPIISVKITQSEEPQVEVFFQTLCVPMRSYPQSSCVPGCAPGKWPPNMKMVLPGYP